MSRKPVDHEGILLQHLNSKTYSSKTTLMIKTGFCDRTLRRTVENLRRQGHLIVSSDDNDTNGYKIASTQQEINLVRRLYQSRIKTELETLTAMFGSTEVESWLGQACMIIRKERREQINAAIKEQKCINCGQCNELDGVCVYGVVESEG